MNKLTKFLATVVLSVGLMFGSVASIYSNKTMDAVIGYTVIKEFVSDEERSKTFFIRENRNPRTGFIAKSFTESENTTKHDKFKLTWIDHYLHWHYADAKHESAYVASVAKDYQSFVSPDSRGYIFMKVADFDLDGVADYWDRRYYLIMQDDVVMMPDFPEGFVDKNWYVITQQEANEFLKREMKFWVKIAGNEV